MALGATCAYATGIDSLAPPGVPAKAFPSPRRPVAPIVTPSRSVEHRIEVGVLVVGAGPAGLACAIRFGQLLADDPETAERLGDVPLAVVDKGKQPGSHLLSDPPAP